MDKELIALIAAVATIIGFIYSLLRNFKEDINKRFDQIDKRFDKIESEVKELKNDMNRIEMNHGERLARIEGILTSKDCCVIKDDRQLKKVE